MLMETLLRSKELWHLEEVGYDKSDKDVVINEAEKAKLADLRLKNLKVKNYLFATIDKTILNTILQKNTAKELWDAMKEKVKGMRTSESLKPIGKDETSIYWR